MHGLLLFYDYDDAAASTLTMMLLPACTSVFFSNDAPGSGEDAFFLGGR